MILVLVCFCIMLTQIILLNDRLFIDPLVQNLLISISQCPVSYIISLFVRFTSHLVVYSVYKGC
jgi:hypothetical protein